LLLSFPVFVVVVAVDPRWLAQSLTAEYPELLGGLDHAQAAPQDYLEKIFQIPFCVAPLGLDERRRLVTGLLGPEAPAALNCTVEASGPAPDEPLGDERANSEQPSVLSASDGTSVAGMPPTSPFSSGTSTSGGDPDVMETVDLTPSSLTFSVEERTFLERLLPLLDTSPRGIKRYINIYHLIKSVVGIDGDDYASYEPAMLLLALQTGLPAVGPEVVRRLARVPAAVNEATPFSLASFVSDAFENSSREDSDETECLRTWLEMADDSRWPLDLLARQARHVRLYNFR